MNTRLQVEHPVTELVTGIDLVQLQIRVAEGEPLPFTQDDDQPARPRRRSAPLRRGPRQRFLPSPGKITPLRPGGPGIREDAGVYEGSEVSIDYDPCSPS